jgi:hypothetical protein
MSVSKEDQPKKDADGAKRAKKAKPAAQPEKPKGELRWNASLYYAPNDVKEKMTYYTACNHGPWGKAVVTSKDIEIYPATAVGNRRSDLSGWEFAKEPYWRLEQWERLWVGRGLAADNANTFNDWTLGNGLIAQKGRVLYHLDGTLGEEEGDRKVPQQFALAEKEEVEQAQSVVGQGEEVFYLIKTNRRYISGESAEIHECELGSIEKDYFCEFSAYDFMYDLVFADQWQSGT